MFATLLFTSIIGHAGPPALTVTFNTARGAACAILLTKSTDPDADHFVISALDVPGLPRATAETHELLRDLPERHGDARRLSPEGLGNYAEGSHGDLLADFVNAADPVLARARAITAAADISDARAALAFVRSERPGRAVLINAVAPMRGEPAVQGQAMLLLLPDEIYPRGVIVGAHGGVPTWRTLLNLRWRGEFRRSALLAFARVTEPARAPSYLTVIPPPGPTFVNDDTVTLEILNDALPTDIAH